jgi:hypothetical protein
MRWWKATARFGPTSGRKEKPGLIMRFMITCRIPVQKGNELVKTGTLGPTVQSIMEDLQPEAAYFVDVDGARGAHIVVDMEEASQIPPVGGTPHACVGGRNRGPPRDGLGGLGQGERGVRASGPEIRLRRCVLRCNGAGVPRYPGPSLCLYSPKCVEEEFCELRHNSVLGSSLPLARKFRIFSSKAA